uniref:L-ascorbate peroxidase n=1 Tax=Zea mays TaxID=4577 RepID=C0PBT8_MAIZE|nr:unknown [Zea mays]
MASDAAQVKAAREDIRELLRTTHSHPILVRLGWHDAGTYDKNIEEWPQRGGANGSLRFDVELKHGANAGLINALKLIQPIKDKYPSITYADLFQLASATAIEEAGGPKIPMKYGRVDVTGPEQCPPEGKLPDAGPSSPADHLREVFYRMGLNDKEIVALSGAHTLGRSRPERSGWGKPETKYTVCSYLLYVRCKAGTPARKSVLSMNCSIRCLYQGLHSTTTTKTFSPKQVGIG